MKRLIKKAEVDIARFSLDWFDKWQQVPNSTIQQIIQENPDCMYNGVCYRFMEVPLEELRNILEHLEKNEDFIDSKIIQDAISGDIKFDNRYCSWAKNIDSAKRFGSHNGFDTGIIIESRTQGINLVKLYTKHEDELVQSEECDDGYDASPADMIDAADEEDEVIGIMKENAIIAGIYRVSINEYVDLEDDTVDCDHLNEVLYLKQGSWWE